ncbi:hypothetical protein, partial [Daejeonella sp.]|uniref:hypothetical protein n=1 Tax=Daejeonella sp. TaxID=2805397 RepID=UPI0030BEAE3C
YTVTYITNLMTLSESWNLKDPSVLHGRDSSPAYRQTGLKIGSRRRTRRNTRKLSFQRSRHFIGTN